MLHYILSLYVCFSLVLSTSLFAKEPAVLFQDSKNIQKQDSSKSINLEKQVKKVLLTQEAVEQLLAKYITYMATDKIVEGFELITPYIYRNEEDIQDIFDSTQEQLEKIKPDLGKYIKYDIVRKQSLNDIVTMYSILVQYENMPLRWDIVFYKNEKGWIVLKIYWDDLPELLLQAE